MSQLPTRSLRPVRAESLASYQEWCTSGANDKLQRVNDTNFTNPNSNSYLQTM